MDTKTYAVSLCIFAILLLSPLPAAAEQFEVPGSGNPEVLLQKLAKAFNDKQSEHKVIIPTSVGTSGAIRAIEQGTATLARVGRTLKPEELEKGITFVPLGHDPVVLVAGADVKATNLTSHEILSIYRGEITDWKELSSESGPIRAVGREISDASRSAMCKYIPELAQVKYGPGIKIVHLDPQLVKLLDRYPTSFGILNKTATLACRTEVVIIKLDGMEATIESLRKNQYPTWLELGLIYTPSKLTSGNRAFINFIKSPQGSAILEGNGVLPIEASK